MNICMSLMKSRETCGPGADSFTRQLRMSFAGRMQHVRKAANDIKRSK